jgi:uncharacterized protein YchJ
MKSRCHDLAAKFWHDMGVKSTNGMKLDDAFIAGFTAAVDVMQERERVASEALEKVQAHGLHHYEDCKNREYDDQECNCGMEKLEMLILKTIEEIGE